MRLATTTTLVAALILAAGVAHGAVAQRILLTNVKAITFRAGSMTSARRSSPVQQLACSGAYCYDADIRSAQCRNAGDDGAGDVQWKCEAQMPDGIDFDRVSVNCEGYDSPNDPYILKGSCGLEYTLRANGQYNANRNRGRYDRAQSSRGSAESYGDASDWSATTSGVASGVNTIAYFAVVAGIFYWLFLRKPAGVRPTTGDAPQPGFWSGMAGGALLANLFGGRRNNYYAGNGYNTYGGYHAPPQPAYQRRGYFGGGASPNRTTGSSGSGSGTHTSAGYGGTTRR